MFMKCFSTLIETYFIMEKKNIFNICLSLILVLGACFHLAYDISCSFCLGNAGAGDRSEPTGQIPLKVSQES